MEFCIANWTLPIIRCIRIHKICLHFKARMSQMCACKSSNIIETTQTSRSKQRRCIQFSPFAGHLNIATQSKCDAHNCWLVHTCCQKCRFDLIRVIAKGHSSDSISSIIKSISSSPSFSLFTTPNGAVFDGFMRKNNLPSLSSCFTLASSAARASLAAWASWKSTHTFLCRGQSSCWCSLPQYHSALVSQSEGGHTKTRYNVANIRRQRTCIYCIA